MKRLVLVCLVTAGAAFAACKSGEGERCQIDDDCSPPLVCNKAKNTCQSTTGGDLDASVPDAPPADASTIDTP